MYLFGKKGYMQGHSYVGRLTFALIFSFSIILASNIFLPELKAENETGFEGNGDPSIASGQIQTFKERAVDYSVQRNRTSPAQVSKDGNGQDTALTGEEQAAADSPPPIPAQDGGSISSSAIEKAYRLQYSDIILGQLGLLNNVDQTSADMAEKYLTQFGYDLFRPGNFFHPGNVVLPEDYILGSGDVLRINMWGSGADVQIDGTIDPDGTITLPKLGVIPLAGVRYREVRDIITREAEKYIQGINLSVAVIQPRSLEIYIVGQVTSPGLKMVPAFSTVLNALVQSDGPLKVGSLRNIVLYRNGRLYRKLDLYDIILKGDTSNDVLLKDKDVIHVPYIGPTVAVVGAVRRSGIFEMKGDAQELDQILTLAGGVLPQAQAKLNLRRFVNNQALNVLDVDLTDPQLAKSYVLDGDLVEIRYIEHRLPRTVAVSGHIWDTQVFSWRNGMRLSEIIPGPEKLKPGAITKYAVLRRYNPRLATYTDQKILLSDVWTGQFDLVLRAYDEVVILSKTDYKVGTQVFLRGAVWGGGDYPFLPGMTLRDLLVLGGGIKEYANIGTVEISRQTKISNEIITHHFQVDLANETVDEPLKPFDMVRVPAIKGAGVIHEVIIKGEVRFPGNYALKDGERLSDLISRAGGYLPSAYLYGAKFFSISAQTIQQQSLTRLIEELEVRLAGGTVGGVSSAISGETAAISEAQLAAQKTFIEKLKSMKATGRVVIKLVDLEAFKGSRYDFALETGDILEIPPQPVFINVLGSVYAPNSYLYNPEHTLQDYLDMAGGPTKTSDKKYMSLHKADGEVISLASKGSHTFYRMKLMPGDSLLVPENLERVPHLRYVKDISDIIYQMTVTLGVVANLIF